MDDSAATERQPIGGHLVATRVNSFRAGGRSVADAVRAAARVPGLSALELNYPQHLTDLPGDALARLLEETGLLLTGLNLRFEGRDFANGAFTSPDEATRDRAVRMAQDAVDLAAAHGARHVILWMADDGFDYAFQADYARLWHDEIAGFRAVAEHNPAVRVSVEYKAFDPRRFPVVRTMGEAMLAVRDVGLANFGVTIDFCHSLMAGEHPAFAADFALREGKLFGVHLNDGYGRADDGLIVGSVHPTETLELLYLMRQRGYDGTIYFDTFPVREAPERELRANLSALRALSAAAERLPVAGLASSQARQDAVSGLDLAATTLR